MFKRVHFHWLEPTQQGPESEIRASSAQMQHSTFVLKECIFNGYIEWCPLVHQTRFTQSKGALGFDFLQNLGGVGVVKWKRRMLGRPNKHGTELKYVKDDIGAYTHAQ